MLTIISNIAKVILFLLFIIIATPLVSANLLLTYTINTFKKYGNFKNNN